MRDIKIRYIVRHKASGNIEVKHYYLNQIEQRPLKELSPAFLADYEILSRDLYTGLEDKNGKEVYEGDVVKRTMNDSHINIFIGKVIFHEGTYFIVCGSDCILLWPSYEGEKNEIIGNIYQHPHLLEESK